MLSKSELQGSMAYKAREGIALQAIKAVTSGFVGESVKFELVARS
jgi:hypothetical protein